MSDRQVNRNGHVWIEARLSDYMDNQLPPLERAQLERHLRDCARCQGTLDSLQWTVALLKHAPAPKLPRSFTLRVPAPAPRAPIIGLSALRLATALATLVFVSLVGIDLILNLGGAGLAPAPLPAARKAQSVPPTSIALGMPPTPTNPTNILVAPAAATAAPPTAAPAATQAPQPTKAPAATTAPTAAVVAPSPTATRVRPLAQPFAGTRTTVTPTPVFRGGGGPPPETSANKGAQDTAEAATAATAPLAPPPVGAMVATPTVIPPTATGIPPTVTPSPKALAQVEPTRLPVAPPSPVETPQYAATPLRIAELGALFIAVFLGAVTLLLWRKR
ncbi:MAG: zf-HC2 domain-containing protein [Chloroflexi bacterium]|nr:zf-HC2 domain-containing protein [Chloroflexota bacterium]